MSHHPRWRKLECELKDEKFILKYEVEREVWNTGGMTEWVHESTTLSLMDAAYILSYLTINLRKHIEFIQRTKSEEAAARKAILEKEIAELDKIIKGAG